MLPRAGAYFDAITAQARHYSAERYAMMAPCCRGAPILYHVRDALSVLIRHIDERVMRVTREC